MRLRTAPVALLLVGVLGTALAACSSSTPASTETQDPQALATQLVDTYATAVFNRDQEALGNLLSDAYVLRRTDGSGYDRDGYLAALAQDSPYELVSYKITDIQAKQDGDILVATFLLDAEIQENGKPVTSEPSTSLVTFVRQDGQWKLASDAFYSK
ncbi:MAG: nuclear transport factor 2 family protein [Candidatus Nanopelagicales bacterium]